ncbi:hypothetical protein Hdeb2414_s0011g00365031 [Helianthus debilis subsp. tardiflorus]
MMMVKVMFIDRGDSFAMKTSPPSSHKPSAVNSTTSPPFLLHPHNNLTLPLRRRCHYAPMCRRHRTKGLRTILLKLGIV